MAVQADVGDDDSVARLIREAALTYGGLDLLVVNSGGPPAGTFEALEEEE